MASHGLIIWLKLPRGLPIRWLGIPNPVNYPEVSVRRKFQIPNTSRYVTIASCIPRDMNDKQRERLAEVSDSEEEDLKHLACQMLELLDS